MWFNSKEHLSEEYEYCGIVCWKAIKAHALDEVKYFEIIYILGNAFVFGWIIMSCQSATLGKRGNELLRLSALPHDMGSFVLVKLWNIHS